MDDITLLELPESALTTTDYDNLDQSFLTVRRAAQDRTPVSGLTHRFYRYPARFSPVFARACIEAFSKPGDVVCDPYMGGGTTVVEAMAVGRRAVGADINSLSVFVASAKTTFLSSQEQKAIVEWANKVVPGLRCTDSLAHDNPDLHHRPRNMSLAGVRWHRKFIATCMNSIDGHFSEYRSRQFSRCVLLNVGQWALNGRKRLPTVSEFRGRVQETCHEMLAGVSSLAKACEDGGHPVHHPILFQGDAASIDCHDVIRGSTPADLVVTSPPYPGIHMLYHRWQVDGRKETDAPYWIAACNDGDGSTHYNFADRRPEALDRYFERAEEAFSGIRRVVRDGALLIQMVAFSDVERQLQRYLGVMQRAGFSEVRPEGRRRTWRQVPGRRWHANLQGKTSSSREVVLFHEAV